MTHCPTCKRPIGPEHMTRRTCWRCDKPMGRHDKWKIGRDGRIRHRHCDFPQSYLSRDEWARLYRHKKAA
jgi:hypothetical protein